jgi:N-acetyltransferase
MENGNVNGDSHRDKQKFFPIFSKRYKPEVNPLREMIDKVNSTSNKSSPSRKSRLIAKKETPGLTQLVIDAGQKKIGPRFCDECGMLYSPGEPQDEELHRQAHVRLDNVHSVTIWNNPRIIQNFIDVGIIVMVQCNNDSNIILNRLRDFLAWLDSELSATAEVSGVSGSTQRIFLYVYPTKRKKIMKILGCAIVEPLDSNKAGFFLLNPDCSTSADYTKLSAQVGITRLWTDPDYRKKQIATKICDSIRFNSGILGYVVPKDKLAILEPSEDGRRFMLRYSDGKGLSYTYLKKDS